MFKIRKLTNGRTPDMVDRLPMTAANVLYGRAVTASAGSLIAATGGSVFGVCVSNPNQSIEDGGGVNFPLGGTTVYPVVQRVYKDLIVEADVTGTIVIANVTTGTVLDIDATADGLVVAASGGEFVVEEVLADDGTNVTKVAGYFTDTQVGG